MKIVILAAGEGKRLKASVPKPLVKIGNKSMIKIILDKLKNIDNKEIFIVINEKYKSLFEIDLKGYDVKYLFQDKPLGTANALKPFLNYCDKNDDVLILYSDSPLIAKETIINMINLHREENTSVLVATGLTEIYYPYAFVRRNESNQIISLNEREKPTGSAPWEFYIGPIIFKGESLLKNIISIKPHPETGEYYIPEIVNNSLKNNEKVESFIVDDQDEYRGVNTPEDLDFANKNINC